MKKATGRWDCLIDTLTREEAIPSLAVVRKDRTLNNARICFGVQFSLIA